QDKIRTEEQEKNHQKHHVEQWENYQPPELILRRPDQFHPRAIFRGVNRAGRLLRSAGRKSFRSPVPFPSTSAQSQSRRVPSHASPRSRAKQGSCKQLKRALRRWTQPHSSVTFSKPCHT